MYYAKCPATAEYTIKKSRFIGIILPCQTENEAKQQLTLLQKKYLSASHLVYAYRIKSKNKIICRFHDAGEPKGTAGKPVFQQLEGKHLINILCVVIRYFGGIKLGVGGLTRAYGNTAKKTIESCHLFAFIEHSFAEFEIQYKQIQNFEYQLNKLDGIIEKQIFSDKINLLVKLPKKNLPLFTTQFNAFLVDIPK